MGGISRTEIRKQDLACQKCVRKKLITHRIRKIT